MKKLLILLFAILQYTSLSAQSQLHDKDSIIGDISNRLWDIEKRLVKHDRYKLYPTENIYNMLLLDTSTGIIKQVQWSLESEMEYSVVINDRDLTYGFSNIGTFELYPTKNMYQFILLDKSIGRMWHVQWGTKSSERWIRQIF